MFLLLCLFLHTKNRTTVIKIYIGLLVVNIISQLSEIGIFLLNGNSHYRILLKLCGVISFMAGPLLGILFAFCIIKYFQKKKEISNVFIYSAITIESVFIVFSVLSFFYGFFFIVDSHGIFNETPYAFLNEIFISCLNMVLVIYYHKVYVIQEAISMLMYSLLPWIAMIFAEIWYPTPQYLATTLSLIVIFGLFYGDFTKQLIEKDKELQDKQISIMVSQIQPHFIYNTLNTIYFLCDQNPSKAKQAIQNFSDYLRMNLSSLDRLTPIPFESELKHVRIYLQLEQMRFDDLSIIYDIKTTDFLLPALSLQPIVENAVKHGICSKTKGGKITISTLEHNDYYEIIVEDDGKGFDTHHLKDDG